MEQKLQTIIKFISKNKHLSEDQKAKMIASLKAVDKKATTSASKLASVKKVKRSTAVLLEESTEELEQKRKVVDAQSRELEIEAALEKVRAIALSMKETADMPDVCRVIATELKKLGLAEIRNVQTAIFYVDAGTYMNYEYYAKQDKTFITETSYTNHKIHRAFANKMLKGKGGFITTHINKAKLPAWIAYQKTTNVFIDPHLKKAASLTYYWYALGPVALGISTYKPLNKKEIELFKRFRNVFELAYRRFLDIELAIAQAKEVQIELALEKVRAVAMGMRRPEELAGIGETLFAELKALGFTNLRNTEIIINNDAKETVTSYYYSDYGITGVIEMEYKTNPTLQGWINDLKKADDAFAEVIIPENEMKAWRKYREETGYLPDPKLNKAKTVCYYSYSIGLGALSISSFKPVSARQIKILERFRNVFKLSYQRYIDISKAEEQAREALIELALERVRARTMAMQHSDELSETVYILFQQFKILGENPDQATIGIINEEENVIEYWVTMYGNQTNKVFKFSIDEPNVTNRIYRAWKQKKRSLIIDLSGKELYDFATYRESMGGAAFNEAEKKRIINVAFFSKGLINVQSAENRSTESISLLERFAAVFEQTYTRFLDLQKAEAQAREAKVEAVLEKVRSRSLAMHKTDELQELVTLVFEKLRELGVGLNAAGAIIITITEGSKDVIHWLAAPDFSLAIRNEVPYFEHPINKDAWESREKEEEFFSKTYSCEETYSFHKYLFDHTDYKLLPAEVKNWVLTNESYTNAGVSQKHSGIYLYSFDKIPYSEKEIETLKRFSKVFEQAYVRFLDLQKAEAQAREAEIELGLERVRARAMAMQKSEELSELVDTVFKELTKLDFALNWCIINIIDEPSLSNTVWAANPDIDKAPESYNMKFEDYPFHHAMMKGWKERDTKCLYTLEGQEKKIYDEYLFNETEFRKVPAAAQAASRAMEKYVVTFSFSNFGGLQTVGDTPLSEASLDILSRFGKVFDLTYTRFNDLKLAEAQAREAQIEAALEKVRSRSLAMQKSEELKEVIQVVYEQFVHLNILVEHAGFIMDYKERDDMHIWLADKHAVPFQVTIPYFDSAHWNSFKEAKEKGNDFFANHLGFEEKNKFYHDLFKLFPVPDDAKDYYFNCAGLAISTVLLDNVGLYIENFSGISYSEEENKILMRIGKVFQQTYTRFLDLQKAEAQAREARIETALERVRSRTMAMYKSDELAETAAILTKQLNLLGIEPISLYIGIFKPNSGDIEIWSTDENGIEINSRYVVNINKNSSIQKIYDAWITKERFLAMDMQGKELEDWIRYWREEQHLYFKPGTFFHRRVQNIVYFSKGFIAFTSSDEQPIETFQLLERFTVVFNLTYTRFLDLQKAEAQAREAEIELALERVRARTMAMYKGDELADTAILLFDQLSILGIKKRSCGFLIMNDKLETMEDWSANSDAGGKATIVTGTLSFNQHPILAGVVQTWKKGEPYFIGEVHGEELQKYYRDVTSKESATDEIKQKVLALATSEYTNSFYFQFGMMYALTPEPLNGHQINVMQRFAAVFKLTYTRFLDIKQAEAQAKESQIQLALERVRARTMAMQHSNELAETVSVVFKQLLDLGIQKEQMRTCAIVTLKADEPVGECWITSVDGNVIPQSFMVPYDEGSAYKPIYDAWKQHEKIFVVHLAGDALLKHLNHLKEFAKIPTQQFQSLPNQPTETYTHALFFSQGYLLIISNEPLSAYHDIFLRFGTVFEQTYTRFLDLKKAEAQAREAQIETSLERVRSRAMAMQTSEDLSATVNIFFKELKTLGVIPIRCGVGQVDAATRTTNLTTTTSSQQGDAFQVTGKLKQVGHPVLEAIFDNWLHQQEYHPILKGEDIKAYYDVTKSQIAFPEYAEDVTQYGNFFYFKEGFVFAWTEKELPEEELKIFRRFTSVLSLTYRRYTDLKDAEAQTREAQIELSLERVRAKTMAMHNSNDVADSVLTLFDEVTKLGIETIRCGIGIGHDGGQMELWTARPASEGKSDLVIGHMDMMMHPLLQGGYNGWKNKEKSYSYELKGDDLINYYTIINNHPDYPVKYDLASLPSRIIHDEFYFPEGSLYAFSVKELPAEAKKIFNRFAAVFGQTYRRYLDLQKAEAQAREAKIEYALEKVRSRTMAMQKSEELPEISSLLFQQVKELGVTAIQNSIGIVNEETGFVELSTTIHGSHILHTLHVPVDDPHVMAKAVTAWKAKRKSLTLAFEGQELKNYNELRNSFLETKVSFPEDHWIVNICFFSKGWLSFSTDKNISGEIILVLKRFAAVFEQTYTRFLDLQKAEAQTREAQIEAAMEKVRARAMGMQKPNELVEVAQLLRSEMGLLGVEELETSSIYIHNQISGTTECWYAIQDIREGNKKLVADHMNLVLNDTWVGREMLKFYSSVEKQTSILMQGDNRKEWINYCAEHSTLLQGYYGEVIPERIYHLVKFSNGYIGAASPGNISAESWDLLKRATSVFSLAYTRFSDLQLAEAQAREAQIETGLERVRSRTLAMQKSDELAETAAVLFKQLIVLGIAPNRLYIGIIKDETGIIEFWVTDEDGSKVSTQFSGDISKNISMHKMYDAWKQKKQSLTIDMQGNELQNYFHYLADELHVPFKQGLLQTRRIQTVAYFSKGFIGIASPAEQPEETTKLLERFSAVFNLTFTRFNDLQIAEAHALQAEEDLIKLQIQKKRAEDALTELRSTQTQLIQSEKMASLGELTAGIAHEIQNPLNFVNNFSEVSKELLDEMKAALDKGDVAEAEEIARDVIQNLEKINHHGKRADAIVKGMLQHSRINSGQKELTDINALVDEYIRLCYHGLRAKDKAFNSAIVTDFDTSIEKINIVPQDIGRVLLNLLTNAFYAVNVRYKAEGVGFAPTVSVSTKRLGDKVEIKVSDNGSGIPQNIVDKIFQPFFTTKPTGQGTGLGLSLSYDIIKAHGGEIKVETKEGEGTTFIIQIPVV